MAFFTSIGRAVAFVFCFIAKIIGWIIRPILGRFNWTPPGWLRMIGKGFAAVGRWMGRHVKTTVIGGVVLLGLAGAAGGGWYWYINQPQPYMAKFTIYAPGLTGYQKQPYSVKPVVVRFTDSVAPLAAIKKEVISGITMSPEVKGKWRWESDRSLYFYPEGDWPIEQSYKLRFASDNFFAKGALLDRYEGTFLTQPFKLSKVTSRLYEDPTAPEEKKLVATISASHPLDKDSVIKSVSVSLSKGMKYRGYQKDTKPQVFFSESGLEAYVHSAFVDVPLENGTIYLHLRDGIKAEAGGKPVKGSTTSVSIPGRYQLSFSKAWIDFVDNKKGEPEPVLFVESNKAIADGEMAHAIAIWQLPKQDDDDSFWRDIQINEALLARSTPIQFTHIESDAPHSAIHAYRFKAEPKRQLYIQVKKRVESAGGYLTPTTQSSLLNARMPEYPKLLSFLSEGALLNLNGEKNLAIVARGVTGAEVEIARILPKQLHHIVGQLDDKFVRPDMSDASFDEFVERANFTVPLNGSNPAKTEYAHVDLKPYLDYSEGRRGIFVLRVSPNDQEDRHTLGRVDDMRDVRFIVVTDLGIIAKRTPDGGNDIFVQSMSNKAPVADAKVEVYGVNGLPVAMAYTDEGGHVRFEDLGSLTRERRPLMYVVTKDHDQSFLPIANQGRLLDMSRFAIGGVSEEGRADTLSGYLFTERGLYRPGETVHIGAVVRSADWLNNLTGLPVKLKIYDPRGHLVESKDFNLDSTAFESYDFVSNAAAPAGTYSAELVLPDDYKTKQSSFLGSVNFSVRDFEPDRMKVKASLSAGEVKGWLKPEEVTAKVSAMHLFGAPANGRRVSMTMRLEPLLPNFKGYTDYNFYLWKGLDQSSTEELADQTTDDNGEATFDLDLKRFTATAYDLQIMSRVFEADGGRNVAADKRAMVSAKDYMVGVKIIDDLDYVRKDTVRKVRWVAIDPQLKSIDVQDLTRELVEVCYVSVLVKQNDGTYRYQSRRKETVLENTPFSIAEGGFEEQLKTDEPGSYIVNIRKGEEILNQFTYSVIGQANATRSLDRNAELQLVLNKSTYAPGEEIEVAINAPYTGSGLITIERDRVYQYVWFKADTTSSVQRIRLPHGLEGNAYINVQFVRGLDSDEIFMSPLSYGVKPFQISLDARKVDIALETPKTILPGNELDVKVKLDRPAHVVVWGVDEGILQVARYVQPHPLEFFFRKRALEVSTSQILDLLLPEFSRLMRAAAAGGDEDSALATHLNPFKRKNKPPVVWWSYIVKLPEGQSVLNWKVPDYFNGQVHFFAMAVDEGHIGVTQAYTDVRGPVVLTPNLPAFVAPGDKFVVSSGIFSNLEKTGAVKLWLKPDDGVKLVNAGPQDFTIEPKHEAKARFELEAGDVLGSHTLEFVAEMHDGQRVTLSETLSIRPASERRVRIDTGSFSAKKQEIKPIRDLFAEFRHVEVGAAGSPLVWSAGLRNYLENYQYSCTEQIVSKVMPEIVLKSSMDEQATSRLNKVLAVLSQRQNSSGGFGVWVATPNSAPYVTLYVADFMIEARERGFNVPQSRIDSVNRYLRQAAKVAPMDGLTGARYQAYAIYLLTRQGEVTGNQLSALRERLDTYFEAKVWQADLAGAYMAATYKLLKLDKQANALIGRQNWQIMDKWYVEYSYHDPLTRDSELLHLIARHFPERLKNVPADVLQQMGKVLKQQRYNSLSASLMIRALDSYEKVQQDGMALSIYASLSAEQQIPLTQAGRPQRAEVPTGAKNLVITKDKSDTAFFMLSEDGYDRNAATEPITDGIEVFHDYTDLEGKPIKEVKVGEEFMVQVKVRTVKRSSLTNVAVVDLLPGGVEAIYRQGTTNAQGDCDDEDGCDSSSDTNAFPVGEDKFSDWSPDFVDPRDDRVVIYGTITPTARTFSYKVRAVSEGSFITPPAFAESLYEPTMVGQGAAGRLNIVAP